MQDDAETQKMTPGCDVLRTPPLQAAGSASIPVCALVFDDPAYSKLSLHLVNSPVAAAGLAAAASTAAAAHSLVASAAGGGSAAPDTAEHEQARCRGRGRSVEAARPDSSYHRTTPAPRLFCAAGQVVTALVLVLTATRPRL